MGWWKICDNEKNTMEESQLKKKKKERRKYVERIPPEGGWGWMVVAGYTLTTVVSIPIIQNFGLIFKQRLADLNLTSTDITTIISLNSAIGQICGVAQGPLLKRFGYRKMAVVGVATFTLGTLLTGLSQSLTHFILTYGIITSIGFTYTLTSFSIAMSSYFRKKRSRASGLLMGFGGLGPVFMPQLVTFSLDKYGVSQTSLLLAALNANGFIGACLLRPIHWYAKKKRPEKEDSGNNKLEETKYDTENDCTKNCSSFNIASKCTNTTGKDILRPKSNPNNLCHDDRQPSIEEKLFANGDAICGEHIGGVGNALGNRRSSRVRSISASEDNRQTENSNGKLKRQCSVHDSFFKTVHEEESPPNDSRSSVYYSCASVLKSNNDLRYRGHLKKMLASQETLDSMGSTFGISLIPQTNDSDSEHEDEYIPVPFEDSDDVTIIDDGKNSGFVEEVDVQEEKKIGIGAYLKKVFDLDLLTEPKYIVITLGLSIAVIGELMFSLLTPFILAEVGLNIQETAYFMSTIGVADIVSRFLSPYVGELIRFNSRLMYILALFFLIFSRTSLLFVSGNVGFFIVALAVGFAKGVRTVFWIQVLPDNVEAKKLPSAMSIQNLMNGLMILVAGPISGKIVEINNSYLNIIYISNVLTALTVLLWAGEYVVVRFLQYRKNKRDNSIKDTCGH